MTGATSEVNSSKSRIQSFKGTRLISLILIQKLAAMLAACQHVLLGHWGPDHPVFRFVRPSRIAYGCWMFLSYRQLAFAELLSHSEAYRDPVQPLYIIVERCTVHLIEAGPSCMTAQPRTKHRYKASLCSFGCVRQL